MSFYLPSDIQEFLVQPLIVLLPATYEIVAMFSELYFTGWSKIFL